MLGKRVLLSCVALVLAATPTAADCPLLDPADCVYVDDGCPNPPGTGIEMDPFCTIQSAYNAAVAATPSSLITILVMPGTYNECPILGDFNVNGDLLPPPNYVDQPVHLIADAWLEAGMPVPDPADPSAFETVATATTITGLGVCDPNSIPGATVSIAGSDAKLEGFTIANGGASGVNARGGVDVSHNLIRDNISGLGGGVFLSTEPCAHSNVAPVVMTARISSNVVRNNVADDLLENEEGGSGGGIFVNADGVATTVGLCNAPGGQADVTISNNVVRLNTARNLVNPVDTDSFASGGGIAIEPITASNAPTGGVFPTPVEEWQVRVLVSGNTITDNTVEAGDGQALGGGIATASTGPGLETLTLENNTVGPGNLAISDALLGFGGGISISDFPFLFCLHDIIADGNTITGNAADLGGGLDLLIIPLQLETDQRLALTASNNRIENNSATREGGGLSTEFNSLSSLDAKDAALFSPPVVGFLAEEISVTIRGNELRNNSSVGVGGGAVLLIDADADPFSQPPFCAPTRPAVAQIDFFGNLVEGNTADNALVLDLGNKPIETGCPNSMACENAVCALDSFCCDTEWDVFCAEEAVNLAPASCNCESSNCCGTVVVGSGILFTAQARGEAVANVSIGNSTIVDNSIITNGGLVGGTEVDGVTLPDCDVLNTGRVQLNVDRSILAGNDGFGLGGPDPGVDDVTATVTNTFVFDNGVAGGANQFQSTLFPTDPPGNFSTDPLLDPVSFVPNLCSPVYDVAGFCENDPGTGCVVDDDCLSFGNPSCVSVGAGFLASPDVNHDDAVDGVDLLRFSTGFGAEDNVDLRYLPGADLDRNGTIDGIDLMFIAPLFAQECVP